MNIGRKALLTDITTNNIIMKTQLLFILSILIFSVSFNACSSDDDSTETGTGTINLYIDGNKMNTNTKVAVSTINYDKPTITFPESQFSIMIMFGKDESESAFFNFKKINLNELKVGDDLVKLCDDFGYQVYYQGNVYWLHSDIHSYKDFLDGKGKFIVKEFNSDKTVINIEFQDVKIPILNSSLNPDKSKIIDIKGNIKYNIDFH